MFNIIVYGEKNDTSISRSLINCLGKYGGVQYSLQDEIGHAGDGKAPSFFLSDLSKINKIVNTQKGCVIFKNKFSKFSPAHFPAHFTPIFDTRNIKISRALSKTNKIVITCGTSAKDTLSLASLKDGSAVISLQRYIKTFNSNIIEPHDFNVKFSRYEGVYPLLSACAVLLMSDIVPDDGYII